VSKPSETDRRYDRYAEIWDNPISEHVIELGNRVLHWSFMENFAPYVARGAIRRHAEDAVRQARERDPEAARRYDLRPRRRNRRGQPGIDGPVWLPVRPDGTVAGRKPVKLTPAARDLVSRTNAGRPAPARATQRSRGRSR
jgi:hypothetical protein